MTLIYLNGVEMPAPTSYDVNLSDIQSSNSGRNDSGTMSMEVVRRDVASINVGWTMITTEELNLITSNIDNDEIIVRFFHGNNYKTAIMYRGDRKMQLKHVDEKASRWDISFSLIEY